MARLANGRGPENLEAWDLPGVLLKDIYRRTHSTSLVQATKSGRMFIAAATAKRLQSTAIAFTTRDNAHWLLTGRISAGLFAHCFPGQLLCPPASNDARPAALQGIRSVCNEILATMLDLTTGMFVW